MLQNILEWKNGFLDYKIKAVTYKRQEIGISPKGLVHVFGQKLNTFPCFYFKKLRLGKRVSRCS